MFTNKIRSQYTYHALEKMCSSYLHPTGELWDGNFGVLVAYCCWSRDKIIFVWGLLARLKNIKHDFNLSTKFPHFAANANSDQMQLDTNYDILIITEYNTVFSFVKYLFEDCLKHVCVRNKVHLLFR